MQVILTHEQADFDAIASMLGAYLLQKEAFAILPNQMNRNVRNFLHLYLSELPFITKEQLPKKPIDAVTLVDTQSLVTIKGISARTSVHVVDHHEKKAGFPSNWQFKWVDTSACTTHFVEQMRENNGSLTIVQSTLMLLGIYEDTGSLIYANTTSRDAQAVAYLLESGASLKIAADFLNPPLSADQRSVFDTLLENLETHTINDCRILVSYARALSLEDEVSSIAHKIADLYDPDGLFTFVETREGFRLVARSITDQINAAAIAREFGGGGHKRAAAALIKHNRYDKKKLVEIFRLFVSELPRFVKPGITAQQIMSKRPLTILPGTTAEEALTLMQQFGYEGYPVVDGKEIKGLLTRRAVDRAIAHKLNLPASSLMESGSISVNPSDSLELLQQVMANSGWGQLPVVDPNTDEIIGIITRTDLLKTLAGQNSGAASKTNLAEQIHDCMPPAHLNLLTCISQVADRLNLPIYLVGGFARDLLLKSPSLDLDFVVEGDAVLLAETLASEYGGRVTSHRKFGTAKWQIFGIRKLVGAKGETKQSEPPPSLPAYIDLISARTEYYEKPTALPTVKKSSIKLDLLRRDFTINTMAVRVDGAHFGDLYDFWGGQNDLEKGVIRVLHSLSFVDDPTRMLRAVRFEQRFAFSIEERTLELLAQAENLLDEVSGDRIRHELDQILVEKKAVKILERLHQLHLFNRIFPNLSWNQQISELLPRFLGSGFPPKWNIFPSEKEEQYRLYGTYIILLTPIPPAALETLLRRLRFKNHLRKTLVEANHLWSQLDKILKWKPSQICKSLDTYSLLAVYCVYFLSQDQEAKRLLSDYAIKWRDLKPSVDGNTLNNLGIKPGPHYRQVLDQLRFAWVDGEITSQKEEQQMLTRLIKKFT